MAEKNKVETIKMVEHSLGVLDLLRTNKEPLGVNEIAKKCDLNPSTAFRILKTLEKCGWVFQLSDDRYVLGQKNGFVPFFGITAAPGRKRSSSSITVHSSFVSQCSGNVLNSAL